MLQCLSLDVPQRDLKISIKILSPESQSHPTPNVRSHLVLAILGVGTLVGRFTKINFRTFCFTIKC